jgi:predicted  nucleic acid-binding Zn-ribbon protein
MSTGIMKELAFLGCVAALLGLPAAPAVGSVPVDQISDELARALEHHDELIAEMEIVHVQIVALTAEVERLEFELASARERRTARFVGLMIEAAQRRLALLGEELTALEQELAEVEANIDQLQSGSDSASHSEK